MNELKSRRTKPAPTGALLLAILLIVGGLSVLAACGGEESSATGEGIEASDGAGTEKQKDATDGNLDATGGDGDDDVVTIEMHTRGGNDYNDPLGVHVEPGTTIRIVNMSGAHTATAYHPDNGRELRIPEGAEPFDSGTLAGSGETFEIVLNEEGVYDYLCTLHEARGHVGRIVVGDPEAAPARDSDGLPGRAGDFLPPVDEIVEEGAVAFE